MQTKRFKKETFQIQSIKKGDYNDACLMAIKLKIVDCLLLAKSMKCKTILLYGKEPRLRYFQYNEVQGLLTHVMT